MTEEEEKAIKDLKSNIEYAKKCGREDTYTNQETIYIVLNIIQNQQSEVEKQNKIIDKMAEYLASIDFDEHCAEIPDICMRCPKEDDLDGYMQCIKQYFERKAKNENI